MLDLAPITRHLRAKASSHLLVAAIHYIKVFEELKAAPLFPGELRQKLLLEDRPAMVLFPALCAMELIKFDASGKLDITSAGHYLTIENPYNLIGYSALEKDDPAVTKMVAWLQNDGPKDKATGVSYVKDEMAHSPMDDAETARYYTLALAGRAKYLSPVVASKITRRNGVLLDVAAGTGYYTYEWLIANPTSTAIVFDRPEVLKVAAELLDDYCADKIGEAKSIKDRVTFKTGDMLKEELPHCDILLAASLFHDWPTDICEQLAHSFAKSIRPGGELWVHDAFLNDSLDGPLAVTDYSAMLFIGTKGRAYSRKELRLWLSNAGLLNSEEDIPTLMDYGLIWASKP